MIEGYKVEVLEAPHQFIRLTGRGDKVQCAWGRKAAAATRKLAKYEAALVPLLAYIDAQLPRVKAMPKATNRLSVKSR